ncbi:PREDICTED: protein CLEC16A-like, partial [Amphimedon queenslandica]|uniref:FPL domain-containing protein n=1 Tax=Amphimedon queenslandica TaxID=400682 RepID=A0AAN0JNY7_AMPQE
MSFLQRQRNFWNEMLWKPKKHLSLDQLKYHYTVIERNPAVTEANKKLLVETFRSIAEILIWGDQNDSSVFDFFLEKNMQSYFLRILSQHCGRYMVLQLLQTLSILFENIRNETSIYYLLSNNHVNSIIVLKLDFSDEEVLAYYISFLKTLSFKLNKHTIHFFYNEHLRDFPLYTEAIKFFNHPESMVRIAVRTLTLNVYKVEDKNMLEYIRSKTAAPYFSNLVWFIGNHVLELDDSLKKADHLHTSKLESLVAEHLDHLHYIHDILCLDVSSLNEILIDHLLNRLFIPLYVNSMCEVPSCHDDENPHISSKIALFLLSQVFLILSTPMLINQLSFLILTGDQSLSLFSSLSDPAANGGGVDSPKHRRNSSRGSIRGFIPPEEPLSFISSKSHGNPMKVQDGRVHYEVATEMGPAGANGQDEGSSTESQSHMKEQLSAIPECDGFVVIESPSEQEKMMLALQRKLMIDRQRKREEEGGEREEESSEPVKITPVHSLPIISSQFIDSVLTSMIPQSNDDSSCLFAISLVYAIISNEGIDGRLLEAFSLVKDNKGRFYLHDELVGRLLSVLEASAISSVRLVTLHLCLMVLKLLIDVPPKDGDHLTDHHKKKLERATGESCRQLAKYFKTLGSNDDTFLEMFEDEYYHELRFRLQPNHLLMDSALLLPPADTPMTGIDFTRRLPCGDTEKARMVKEFSIFIIF